MLLLAPTRNGIRGSAPQGPATTSRATLCLIGSTYSVPIHGFKKDDEHPEYDARTDFTQFIFSQGKAFERTVAEHLATLTEVRQIAVDSSDVRSLEAAVSTFQEMAPGVRR